ncbi:MAG: Gfo/Idh/MocA family oxidoreductase [Planctomycetia bacterium]|nr:Gfo/Idh/MocA family oxidoreductase [Planctomycetia bacterium]
MARIKIGQIGTGHAHAAGKMEVYRASADFEVVGVVEPDAELAAKARQSPVYKDLAFVTREQLLNTPGLAAVAVETRVADLLDTARACVEAGKHVHLDKPPGSSMAQYRRILDTAARKHLAVQMGYMYRYSPAIVFLRDTLRKGWLGEPFEVHAVMSKVVSPPARRPLAAFSGGMMFELGCHIIDLVVGVLGRPTSVVPFAQHVAPFDDGLRDNTLAVFMYPRALATVKSTAMEVDGGDRRHLVVCGTEGTCHVQPLDAPDIRLTLSKPRDKYQKGYQEVRFGDYPRYVGDAADLARIIRGEREPDFGYEHDLAVQEAVLKACGLPV